MSESKGPREIILLDQARRALAEAETVDEIRDLRDKAQAVRSYVRKARLGKSLVIDAAILRIRAERKLGTVLAELPIAKAAPGNQYTGKNGSRRTASDKVVYLRDLGINESESSRAQRIARIPDNVFSQYLAEARNKETEPSVAALLRLVKSHIPATSLAKRATRKRTTHGQRRQFQAIYCSLNCPAGKSPPTSRELKRLRVKPIGELATRQAHLYFRTPTELLNESLALVQEWGFAYEDCAVIEYQLAFDLLLLCRCGGSLNSQAFQPLRGKIGLTETSLRMHIEQSHEGRFLAVNAEGFSGPNWEGCA